MIITDMKSQFNFEQNFISIWLIENIYYDVCPKAPERTKSI